MEEEAGANLTAVYKDSANQINRINSLWEDTHRHARNGELMKWNYDLDRVWCELAGDLSFVNKKKKTLTEAAFAFMAKQDKLISAIIIKKGQAFSLYKALKDKELYLRQLQNSIGKGTKFADEDEDTFE